MIVLAIRLFVSGQYWQLLFADQTRRARLINSRQKIYYLFDVSTIIFKLNIHPLNTGFMTSTEFGM